MQPSTEPRSGPYGVYRPVSGDFLALSWTGHDGRAAIDFLADVVGDRLAYVRYDVIHRQWVVDFRAHDEHRELRPGQVAVVALDSRNPRRRSVEILDAAAFTRRFAATEAVWPSDGL